MISVIIPMRNEGDRLLGTIASLVENRVTDTRLEVVLVDDCSSDGSASGLTLDLTEAHPEVDRFRVVRCSRRRGVPAARNLGVSRSRGEIVFITDAHVSFTLGWDAEILSAITPDRVLAATIRDHDSRFAGYGCRLVVPFMGTYWNREPRAHLAAVQIAAASGTILTRELFDRVGGYDPGMGLYGAAEPEFSVRLWLAGAEIRVLPDLGVFHRFKPPEERRAFLREVRTDMVHNSLRFGLIYLDERSSLEMIRHHATKFPEHAGTAMRALAASDVWDRRAQLARELPRSFEWFVERFDLVDQVGAPLTRAGP